MQQAFGPGMFRLVLAAMVVTSHVLPLNVGRVAVVAFFVLSGYWVTRMYREKYAGQPESLLHFYASRFLRIYPIYFVILALTLVLVVLFRLPMDLHLYDLTLLTVFPAADRLLTPSWSLNIELQFYLVAPFVIWAMGARPGTGRLIALFAGAIAVTIIDRLLLRGNEPTVLSYAAPFAFGLAAGIVRPVIGRRLAFASLAAFLGAAAVAVLVPGLRWILLKHDLAGPAPIDGDDVSVLWGMLAVPFVLWTVTLPSNRRDRTLGDVSYVLYLVHYPLVTRHNTLFAFLADGKLRRAMGLAVTIAATWLLYRYAEQPIERLRRRLFDPRRKPDITLTA